MSRPSLWERLRGTRIAQVVLVYLGASWFVLQIAETLVGLLALPEWVGPVAVVLLLVGLVVVAATAWVQSLPQTTAAEEAGEVPTDWEVDAADVVDSLKQGKLPHLTWGRAIVGGVVALSLLFGGAGLYVIVNGPVGLVGPQEAGAESVASGIAVLPFHVTGPELDVYREGMVDLMSANLDGLSEFRAIDARTVLARWNRDIGETADAELDDALRVAASTGARYAVVGSGVEAGGQVRFTAEIYDLSNGSQVGDGGQVEGAPEEVLGLVDALTVEIMRSVLDATGQGSSAQTFRLASLLTESVPALRHYLEGDAAFRRTQFDEARDALERAIEEDSTFALAHWRLGETIGWIDGIGAPDGVEAKRRAQELGGRLPEREGALLAAGFAIADGHAADEADNLEAYVRRYPDDPDGWYLIGEAGLHGIQATGLTDADIEEALVNAVELDPSFGPYYEHALQWAAAKGQETEFDAYMRGAEEAGDNDNRRERARLRWDLLWGNESERAAAAATIATMENTPASRLDQGILGLVDERLERLEPLWVPRTTRPILQATLYGQQGRLQELLAAIDTAGNQQALFPAIATLINWQGMGGIPRDLLAGAYERVLREEDTSQGSPVFAAILAGSLGDAAGYAAAVEQSQALISEFLPVMSADADTVGVRAELLGVPEAERLLNTGDAEAAYGHFVDTQVEGGGGFGFFREWRGRFAMEAGRWQEGIRWMEGLSRGTQNRTTAKYWLGKAYEATGDTERALDAYRVFLSRTEGADPGLPAVEEVREAVARLGG